MRALVLRFPDRTDTTGGSGLGAGAENPLGRFGMAVTPDGRVIDLQGNDVTRSIAFNNIKKCLDDLLQATPTASGDIAAQQKKDIKECAQAAAIIVDCFDGRQTRPLSTNEQNAQFLLGLLKQVHSSSDLPAGDFSKFANKIATDARLTGSLNVCFFYPAAQIVAQRQLDLNNVSANLDRAKDLEINSEGSNLAKIIQSFKDSPGNILVQESASKTKIVESLTWAKDMLHEDNARYKRVAGLAEMKEFNKLIAELGITHLLSFNEKGALVNEDGRKVDYGKALDCLNGYCKATSPDNQPGTEGFNEDSIVVLKAAKQLMKISILEQQDYFPGDDIRIAEKWTSEIFPQILKIPLESIHAFNATLRELPEVNADFIAIGRKLLLAQAHATEQDINTSLDDCILELKPMKSIRSQKIKFIEVEKISNVLEKVRHGLDLGATWQGMAPDKILHEFETVFKEIRAKQALDAQAAASAAQAQAQAQTPPPVQPPLQPHADTNTPAAEARHRSSLSTGQIVKVSLTAGAVGLAAVGLTASAWPLIAAAGIAAIAVKFSRKEGFFDQLTAPFRSGVKVFAAAPVLGPAAAAGGWLGPYVRPIITNYFSSGEQATEAFRYAMSHATDISLGNIANAGIGIVGFTLLFGTAICAFRNRTLQVGGAATSGAKQSGPDSTGVTGANVSDHNSSAAPEQKAKRPKKTKRPAVEF